MDYISLRVHINEIKWTFFFQKNLKTLGVFKSPRLISTYYIHVFIYKYWWLKTAIFSMKTQTIAFLDTSLFSLSKWIKIRNTQSTEQITRIRSSSKSDEFIQNNTVRPDIRFDTEYPVTDSFRRCPLYRNHCTWKQRKKHCKRQCKIAYMVQKSLTDVFARTEWQATTGQQHDSKGNSANRRNTL